MLSLDELQLIKLSLCRYEEYCSDLILVEEINKTNEAIRIIEREIKLKTINPVDGKPYDK